MDLSKLSLILIITILTSVSATASQAELTIFPEQSSTEINNYTHYEVGVQNVGPVKDVYEIQHNYPGEIRHSAEGNPVELEAGESKNIQLWFNPNSDRSEGTYQFTISAKSRADGNSYSTKGRVTVIKDYNVDISVEPSKTVCRGETATYNVQITNEGIQDDEFALTTGKGQLSKKRVALGPGETTTVTLTVKSDTETSQNFNVGATSTSVTYASDSENLQFNAETCYESSIEVTPETQKAAAFTPAEFNVAVTNQGTKEDEFTLESDQVDISGSPTVQPGETATGTFTYTPEELGRQQITVTASGNSEATTTATVKAYNGMKSNVDIESGRTLCREQTAQIQASITNTGEASEEFTLSSNRGTVSQESITIQEGETENVNISVDAGELNDGSHALTLQSKAATFNGPTSSDTAEIAVENCWDLEMEVVPQVASTGENMSTIYEIRLNNVGSRENTYELAHNGPEWIQIRPDSVTVPSNSKEVAYMYAGPPFEQENKSLEITAVARGKDVERSQTVELVVGEELRDSILSGRGGLTGSFTASTSRLAAAFEESSNLERGITAITLGIIITLLIIYREI